MRRLTAIFAPRRSGKSDAGSVLSDTPPASHSSVDDVPGRNVPTTKSVKARSGFFRSLSRNGGSNTAGQAGTNPEARPKRHPMPSLTTDPSSSASSSSGGPHTPDDDHASLVPGEPYRVPSWLPSSSPPLILPDDARISGLNADLKLSSSVPSLPQIVHDTDDDSSDGSSESEVTPLYLPQSTSTLSPIAYLQALTIIGIAPPFSPPPLLHIPGGPIYPRSCNSIDIVSTEETLRTLMFRKRLLRRVTGGSFSSSDTACLAAYGDRSRALPDRRPSLNLDDNAVKDVQYIETHSRGLRRWVDRPCFEERMALYIRQGAIGGIQVMRITGSELGVASLEFSEGLEAMAGLDIGDIGELPVPPTDPLPFMSPAGSSHASSPPMSPPALPSSPSIKTAQQSVSPSPSRNSLYKTTPSPLRMEHTTSSPISTRISLPASSSSASISTPAIVLSPISPESNPKPISQPSVKQGVRFAEDEKKDDAVPLGYVMRIRQKREEKAKFLQLERDRRAHEEERRRHEEERRRQEEEKIKWERERETWDRERKIMEEERRKRMYAEEVVAARSRRESTRIGAVPMTSNGSPILWDGDRERERERRGREAMPSYLRPAYDPAAAQTLRKGGSESVTSLAPASRNGSPGSSRPPSVGGSAASGSVRGSSQPPSMYSSPPSSATDIHHSRERRESKASKRGSIASESPQQSWTGMNYSPQVAWGMSPAMVPPVPPMPMMPVMPMMPYAIDMPLLPPTPPFMMQQFGPRKSSSQQQRSHSSSPTIGTHRIPSSHSSDRVNQHSSTHPSSPNSRGHERRSSGDISDLHKSRRMTGSSAQSQSHPSSHDGRNISSSSHTHKPPSLNPRTGVSGSSSSRRMDSPSRDHRHHSSSSRPAGAPRSQTMPETLVPIPGQSHASQPVPYVTPTPVLTSSWTQPAFQNLSRPSTNRRQTMIS